MLYTFSFNTMFDTHIHTRCTTCTQAHVMKEGNNDIKSNSERKQSKKIRKKQENGMKGEQAGGREAERKEKRGGERHCSLSRDVCRSYSGRHYFILGVGSVNTKF